MLARVALLSWLLPCAAAAQTADLEQSAWRAFLDDRPREAVVQYAALVDRLPASPSRDEAMVMLSVVLADLDWDHDGVPDAESPLARILALVPPERPWLGALVYETAHALHVTSHDPEAIALTAYALERWPVPTGTTPLDAACRRHRARPETLHDEGPTERAAALVVCARYGL